MSNINRDYLCILDVKTGAINAPKMYFYNTDRSTSNIYVQLVVKETIVSATPIENATDFVIEAKIVKPNGFVKEITGQLVNEADAIYEFDLPEDFTDLTGINQVEFWVRAKVSDREERITSASTKYTVKGSILNSIDDDIEDDNDYPIFLALMERVERLDKEVTEVSLATKALNEESKGELAKIKADEVEIANNEAIRQAQEAAREYSEDTRGVNESRRIQAEAAREQAEETRQEQEGLREDNEIARQSNETSREETEQARQENENTRIANENARREAETARAGAEATRVTAENNREAQETLRQEAEADRVVAEQAREASNTAMRQDITNMQNEISNFEAATNRDIEEIRTTTGQEIDTMKVIVENQNAKIDYIKENDRKQDILINGIFNSQDNKLTSTKEGNVHDLVESKPGLLYVDNITGNTMVNCNKEADKSIVLAGAINEEGTNNITLTQGADGAKADVYVEGNTMVNVCDQEEPVAITKSYTVETGNHVALEGDYDGKCRPVIYGNTLVNVANGSWGHTGSANPTYTLENGIYKLIATSLGSVVITKNAILKNNTKYTIIFDIKHTFPSFVVSFRKDSSYLEGKSKDIYLTDSSDRFNRVVTSITTTTNCSDLVIGYHGSADVDSYIAVKNLIILEGDYTNKPIPDYFEGMQSSFEDKVVTQEMVDSGKELAENLGKYKVEYKVTGKNKFDINGVFLSNVSTYPNLPNGTSIAGNTISMQKGSSGTIAVTYPIKVEVGKSYTISCEITCDGNNMNYPVRVGSTKNDYDLSYVGFNSVGFHQYTFVANDEIIGIKLYCSQTQDNFTVSNIQLEEGSTATAYEPYKEHIKTYYLNSPLLEGDTIEDNGNDVVHVHRYKKIVLDGSENWVQVPNDYIPTDNNYMIYTLNCNDIKIQGNIVSDIIPFTIYGFITADRPNSFAIGTHSNSQQLRICIEKSKLSEVSSTGFKTWLSDNPVTTIYELASPQYELISQNDSILQDSYVGGSLDVDTAVPIEKVEFKVWNTYVRYIYPNTDYVLQFESDNPGIVKLYLGGTLLDGISIHKGLNKINISTTNDHNYLQFDGIGFSASNIVVTEAVEGDFGYFKGMKSVGEQEGNKIEILSRPNLADISTSGATNFNIANLEANKTYTMAFERDIDKGYNLLLVNPHNLSDIKEKVIINSYTDICTFTTTKSGVLRFNGYYHPMYITNIMLVEGTYTEDTMPPYRDYTNNKKQILLNEPLRKVEDVADRYVLVDGKWYIERNCGEIVLDGSEDYHGGNHLENTVMFRIHINNFKSTNIICNTLKTSKSGAWGIDKELLYYYDVDKYLDIRVNRNRLVTQDLLGFKQWLSNNPLSIIYQLASPVYEPIDYNPLDIYSDTTHISVNSNIPAKIKARNHGYNCMLKPSTTYTATYNIDGTAQKTTIVTPATLDDATRFTGTGTLSNFLLLEGDISNPPAFFSGMRSSFDQEYDEVKGKWKVNIRVEGNDTYNDITIYINEPLRKGDIIRAENRKILVERHMGEIVLDGSDDEEWYEIYLENRKLTTLFYMIFDAKKISDYNLCNKVYCNNFSSVDVPLNYHDYEGSYTAYDGNICLSINNSKLKTLDIVGFKQYLSENPVTVVYELASPVIEEVETDYTRLMLESYENATVYFNSHIFPTSTIRYQANVISTSEIMSVSDQQDAMIIDNATQIAMITLTM